MTNYKKYLNNHGFTLLEMLVALTIFIVASIFIVTLSAHAIDKPKQAGLLSDFNNYSKTGTVLLKELGNVRTENEFITELNKELNKALVFTEGFSEKTSPYDKPYKISMAKEGTQTVVTITTEGRKEQVTYALTIVQEGTIVESCTNGFGKDDKKLIILESEHCKEVEKSEPSDDTETEEPPEIEINLPPYTPVTEVPEGCIGVYTALDMYNIRNNLTGCYIVMNPIDLSSYPNWIPIGGDRSAQRFKGTFNGQRYPITNLNVSRTVVNSDDNGLFGRVEGVTFQNVMLVAPIINANSNSGALFGEGDTVTIQDSVVKGGTFTGTNSSTLGGMVGRLGQGTITNAYSIDVNVTGNLSTGGLIGTLEDSYITNGYVSGEVTSKSLATIGTGGLIASGDNTIVENSHSDATVTALQGETGGLMGYTYQVTVRNSSNRGNVKGYGQSTGGLIGQGKQDFLLENSHSTGNVIGSVYVGGLVGELYLSGTVLDSYSTGDVLGVNKVGGLIGEVNSFCLIRNSYSESKVTGSSTVGGFIGLITNSTILDSRSTGDVNAFLLGDRDIAHAVGGFVGEAYVFIGTGHSIERSYSTGSITGETNAYVGGFAGELDTMVVKDAYATGTVSISKVAETIWYNQETGGFAGHAIRTSMANVYASVLVKGSGLTKGHIGKEQENILSGYSYYDTQISKKTGNGVLMVGRTTSQLKQKATYVGWDFDTIWQIEEGVSYPTLR